LIPTGVVGVFGRKSMPEKKQDTKIDVGQTGFLQQLGPAIPKSTIQVNASVLESWGSIVNTLAEFCDVPAVLIRKLRGDHMEVINTSASGNNPYQKDHRALLKDLYCARVVREKKTVLIPNFLKEKGAANKDTELGMVSYMGVPLLWPDGEIFGTLSLLDSKEHTYTPRFENLICKFKELAETQLAMLFKNVADRKSLEYILNNLKEGIIAHDLDRRILFYSDGAEKILGFRREEVLGKDCHEAFGEALCGNRCSFCTSDTTLEDKKDHTLHVTTKNGLKRMIDMSVILMQDENHQDIGALATITDLTELIELQMDAEKIFSFSNIIGRNKKMISVFKQIRDVTDYDFPVHISGETGTGKELVAHAIHNESHRGGAPFVPINCGALPEGLIESELFGHVKGAFSGAIREKKGRFELADGGTVFLDEVSEIPKLMQVKLLRFLQEETFEKVGGEKTISVNTRVISATNKDLKQEVQNGNFREDLFYRLNVIPIMVPSLRERKTDIPLLVDHFLKQFPGHKNQQEFKISDEALSMMMDYRWPGNVRELQNCIQFSIVRCKGGMIRPMDLPLELKQFTPKKSTRGPSRKLDQIAVKEALIKTGGNKVKAAKLLGVGRATLYRFLGKYPNT
jgi:sigma-54 dependent transcriptional regulator, acetoin dehydrogenase operon transcriptional activator AcoR